MKSGNNSQFGFVFEGYSKSKALIRLVWVRFRGYAETKDLIHSFRFVLFELSC
jgi:hypothetical protein